MRFNKGANKHAMRGQAPSSLQSPFQKTFTGTMVTGFSGIVPYTKHPAKFLIKPT